MTRKGIKLGAFLYPTGYHVAAWRHPNVPTDSGINFPHFAALARTAEQGRFDFLFVADSLTMRGTDLPALSRTAIRYVAQFEPFTLLSALASLTERIGLVASATTTYNEPYHMARKLASLDHISGGRAGWNVITSQNENEAELFGLAGHPDHAERYQRAREFTFVVKRLWDTWEDDAFPRDKTAGLYFDPDRLHPVNHGGTHFSIRGVLNVPRPPQGYPVIVQSGSSEPGREMAAELGELIFTAQTCLEDAKSFYDDVKSRAEKYGRSPDDLIVMPGVFPFVGRTYAEAEEKYAELQALIDPVVGLSLLSGQVGCPDLSDYPLDGPLPPLRVTNAGQGRQQLLIDMARREGLTIRQLCLRVAGSRGHWDIIGDAADIADRLQEWVESGAADGFNVIPPSLPGGLDDFVKYVVPELRRRGLVEPEYTGQTFRENLGLRRPPHPRCAKL